MASIRAMCGRTSITPAPARNNAATLSGASRRLTMAKARVAPPRNNRMTASLPMHAGQKAIEGNRKKQAAARR